MILFGGGGVSVQGGGLCPGGWSLSGGGSVQRGHCPGDLPLPSYGNERAVQILLECILQGSHFSGLTKFHDISRFFS